ncbi:MAG: 2-amino-4-hydroxy-6-hydroxymethyldihydropteridine diphosphokinase [Bacteroidetes bacterium]|nr:2-amino-4-hydroxy-6-hydroxymethyldihydropteridine diphosphokinase [Bacteroidota bacterium]
MLYKNIFLLLGSNLGDRLSCLSLCLELIEEHVGTIIKKSSIYETTAWGRTDQPDFLNQAIEIETPFPPTELLSACQNIEKKIGRQREEKWGARTIDIDIIYFGDKIIHSNELTIPHPRMTERKFVLIPLTQISPSFVHPILKKTSEELLKQCRDELLVKYFSPQRREGAK